LVKRYVAEPGSDAVLRTMDGASGWHICRIGYAETLIALTRAAGGSGRAPRRFMDEWPLFNVVEVNQALVESAVKLATAEDLRTLDSLHLAAALLLPPRDRVMATWDERLWRASERNGLQTLPDELP
jgi:predicted nucleic acid-binding protein